MSTSRFTDASRTLWHDIQRRFIDDTGYNSWADTNHLIVLYPQTLSSSFVPFNPQACGIWWSYVNHEDSYVTKSGAQIRAIKAMLDALTAHATPCPRHRGVDGCSTGRARGCRHLGHRRGHGLEPCRGSDGSTASRAPTVMSPFAAIGDVVGPSFGDSGLKPHSAYRWRVSAVVNGVEGPVSIEATASTLSTPAPCDTRHLPDR